VEKRKGKHPSLLRGGRRHSIVARSHMATTAILGLSVVIICGDDALSTDAVVAAHKRSQTTENMAVGNIPSTVKVTVTPGFTPNEPSIKPMVPMLGRGASGVTVKPNMFGGARNACRFVETRKALES
jgi:hypothetical protein